MPGERKNLLGEALAAVHESIRDNKTGSAHLTAPSRCRTCTANARTKKSCPHRNRAVNSGQRSQNVPFGVSDIFLGRVGQLKAVEACRELLASLQTLRCQNTAPVSSRVL